MDTVLQYISGFEPDIRERLQTLRTLFLETVPGTEESIRYNMPAYTVGKHHLYFAAYKKHIGFYPAYGLSPIENEIGPYKAKRTKDTLHFPHHQPLPLELIRRIILLKVKSGQH